MPVRPGSFTVNWNSSTVASCTASVNVMKAACAALVSPASVSDGVDTKLYAGSVFDAGGVPSPEVRRSPAPIRAR